MSLFHTILHPTDFQDKSVEAFTFACQIAREHHADLVVLHVAPKGAMKYLDKFTDSDLEESHERLWSALRKQQHEEDDLQVTHRIEAGAPAKVILKVAEEVKADLLVIGPSDSRSVPLCWWTATTFDELVHQATCPLLVVRQKNETPASNNEQIPEAVAVPSDVALPSIP